MMAAPKKRVAKKKPNLKKKYNVFASQGCNEYNGNSFADEMEELPGCCAFKVIHGLATVYSVKDAEASIREMWDLRARKVPLLATTTEQQQSVVKVLRTLGFRKLVTVKNPNTGNMVTMWLIEP